MAAGAQLMQMQTTPQTLQQQQQQLHKSLLTWTLQKLSSLQMLQRPRTSQ
jgi:hypothetical protein